MKPKGKPADPNRRMVVSLLLYPFRLVVDRQWVDGGLGLTFSMGLSQPGWQQLASRKRLAKGLFALNLAAVLLVLPLLALVPAGDRLIVVTAPWHGDRSAAAVILQAGGELVASDRQGREWMAVGHSEDKGFGGRLIAAGALLVLSGGFMDGCLSLIGEQTNARLGVNTP